MKKFFSPAVLANVCLIAVLAATPVLAAEEEEAASGGVGITTLIELVTLVVVGGILYNLFASLSGFGGQLGQALKIIGGGVAILSLQTLDDVVEGIAHVGSETLLGDGVLHDSVHHLVILLGFFTLAWGLSKLTKIVKGMKA